MTIKSQTDQCYDDVDAIIQNLIAIKGEDYAAIVRILFNISNVLHAQAVLMRMDNPLSRTATEVMTDATMSLSTTLSKIQTGKNPSQISLDIMNDMILLNNCQSKYGDRI